MSPQGTELELEESKVFEMINSANGGRVGQVPLIIMKSDSYGPHQHRTWVYKSECGRIFGSLERYWGGLKMICSVHGSSPRTTFFTEEGTKTTHKGLRSQGE